MIISLLFELRFLREKTNFINYQAKYIISFRMKNCNTKLLHLTGTPDDY
jgi:hypothetical protein